MISKAKSGSKKKSKNKRKVDLKPRDIKTVDEPPEVTDTPTEGAPIARTNPQEVTDRDKLPPFLKDKSAVDLLFAATVLQAYSQNIVNRSSAIFLNEDPDNIGSTASGMRDAGKLLKLDAAIIKEVAEELLNE